MAILKGGNIPANRPPQLLNILGGLGKIVGIVNLRFVHAADFVNGELIAVRIFVDQAADLEEVVLLERVDGVGNVVPHLCVEVAGSIAKSEREKDFAALLRLDLLRGNQE